MKEGSNYAELLDPEIQAFIERTDSHYPPGLIFPDVNAQRAAYNRLCDDFAVAVPSSISFKDDVVESDGLSVPVRRYVSQLNQAHAHIIYIHGGGYVLGDLDSHHDVCAELSDSTQLNVTAVDYRLAPEHKHPAAFEDCVAVVLFEAKRLRIPLILCGDSAGGNLCAAVSHQLRDVHSTDLVAGQVLLYPELGGDSTRGSYLTHANAPMLTLEEVGYFRNIRRANESRAPDASLLPLEDTNFSKLPSTIVVTAECDPLSDDGKDYCNAINQAGGQAQWRCESGLVHGFIRARHVSQRAKASFTFVVDSLRQLAG